MSVGTDLTMFPQSASTAAARTTRHPARRPFARAAMDVPPASDAAIRATNDEAFAAKVSAVRRGYLVDPYALALASSATPGGAFSPRQPMINRGTFARVTFVRRHVARFVAAQPAGALPQVVSLGAGLDTLPFVLLGGGGRPLRYVEVDFPGIVAAKAAAVKATPAVAAVFARMEPAGAGLRAAGARGGEYCVAACDLRDVGALRAVLDAAGVDRAAPTVFVSECVLVYMDPAASDALVRLAAREFTGARAWVNYEPVEPADPFGVQMVANIALRGSPLVGIGAYPSVAAQKARFESAGFDDVESLSMREAIDGLLDKRERARLDGLEMLDEFEEFRMMMEHYCVVWATAAPVGDGVGGV